MKTILNLVAICMTVAIIGCSTTSNTVSPGAISECGAKEGMACTKDKSECCGAARCDGDKAAMGAVSECATKCETKCASKCKSECTDKANCTSTCPAGEASMGAVSECGVKKDCASKCEAKATCASMGAMSEKTCEAKRSCKSSCKN